MTSNAIVLLLQTQNLYLGEICSNLSTAVVLLQEIAEAVKEPTPEPSVISVTKFGEQVGTNMTDMIVYDVNLPSLASPNDVVSRELTVKIGDEVTVITAEKADTVIPGLLAPQDAHVHLELVDIDDSGNRSEVTVFEFDALDTFAPPKPGDFGVVIIGEDLNPSPSPA